MFLGAPLSLLSGVLAEKFGRETVLMYRDPYVCFWHSVSASYMNSMVCRLCNAMLRAGVNHGAFRKHAGIHLRKSGSV